VFIYLFFSAVFIVFDVVGFCVTWKFTPKVEQPYYAGLEVLRKLRSYWQAFCQPKFILLIPLWAARGMNFSLHIGMFTEVSSVAQSRLTSKSTD
jgi:hypothetical protein